MFCPYSWSVASPPCRGLGEADASPAVIDRALAQNRRRCAAAVAASGNTLTQLAGISDVLAAKILGHIS